MNINAKQILSFDIAHMDMTTALSYFGQILSILDAQTALKAAMGSVWTTFSTAYAGFDEAYAQTRKWSQTEELKGLDDERDAALSGFLSMLKVMVKSPSQEKQAAAKKVQFVRDKYTLQASDEYMKETTAISQMTQELEADQQTVDALNVSGLAEWLQDLKTKNQAFLAKMNERTAEQAGMQKGLLKERRSACEAAYRNVVKLVNAMAICDTPDTIDFTAPINLVNAEVEHYRQILARKGAGGGNSSGGDDGGDTPAPTPTPDPTPDPSGGGDDGGGDTPTPTPDPTPDPSGGGDDDTGDMD